MADKVPTSTFVASSEMLLFHVEQCFPAYGHMAKMGGGKCQVGHRFFYHFYWATELIYEPQLIEWSIELLLTNSP